MRLVFEQVKRGKLVFIDGHALERPKDTADQGLHVAVITVIVLGDHLTQPRVVLVMSGLPWLPKS